MAEVQSSFILAVGSPAPDFDLPDGSGKRHRREELMGARGLMVVFACNHCPFIHHLALSLGHFAREIQAMGIGTCAINANDVSRYPQDAPSLMPDFAEASGWDFPYLFDDSQAVAKSYGACCTPDFFLLDESGALFYAGQFDRTRPGSAEQPDGRDMRDAVGRLLAGKEPPSQPKPSSGCSIKWKQA